MDWQAVFHLAVQSEREATTRSKGVGVTAKRLAELGDGAIALMRRPDGVDLAFLHA